MIESLQGFKNETTGGGVSLEQLPSAWEKQVAENMRLLETAVREKDAEAIELLDKSIADYALMAHEFEKSIDDMNTLLGDPSLSRIAHAVLTNDRTQLEKVLMSIQGYVDTYREILSKNIASESTTLH